MTRRGEKRRKRRLLPTGWHLDPWDPTNGHVQPAYSVLLHTLCDGPEAALSLPYVLEVDLGRVKGKNETVDMASLILSGGTKADVVRQKRFLSVQQSGSKRLLPPTGVLLYSVMSVP